MPVVYLDTSHIIKLADECARGARMYEQFLATWRSLRAELALSQVHFHELRRHDFAATRRLRLAVIKDLAPVRLDISLGGQSALGMLTEREGVAALVRLGIAEAKGFPLSVAQIGFPTLLSADDAQGLAVIEDIAFARIYGLQHSATASAARALWWHGKAPRKRTRLRELGAAGIVRALPEAVRERWASASLERHPKKLTAMARVSLLTAIQVLLWPFLLPAAELARQAFLLAVGPALDKAAATRFTDHLVALSSVRRTAAKALEKHGVSTPLARQAASRLLLEDFPGEWLHFAAKLQLQLAKRKPTADDLLDLQHLQYLPYVDVLYADKRTQAYGLQALRASAPSRGYGTLVSRLAKAPSVDLLTADLAERFSP